jgi:hypothetical protein
MSSTNYKFKTTWLIDASPLEVFEIITNSGKLTQWWPSVYLDLKVTATGEPDGTNKQVKLTGQLKYLGRGNRFTNFVEWKINLTHFTYHQV